MDHLKQLGNVVGQFLAKCYEKEMKWFALEDFLIWEKDHSIQPSFSKFLLRFIGKTKEGPKVTPKSQLSLTFLDQSFDYLCEKIRFKINSRNEFFAQIVKFKNQFELKSESPVIREKVSTNLFFHYSLDLFYFIDNQIIEYMYNLVELSDFFNFIVR